MNSSQLASSLRSAVSALHKGLRRHTSAVNTLSMTEMETIGLLVRNEQLQPTELAALTRVKNQSMSQILNRLKELDLIKRTDSQKDKRKVYISLTANGKKMVEKTKYEKDEWLKDMIEKTLTSKEKDLLAKTLPVLNKLNEII